MPGILDQILNTTGFGSLTTSEYREMLLGRNLPPPVNEPSLGGYVTKLQDIGNVINVPIWGTADENIPIHYDEDEKLFPLGKFYRDTQNVNYNTFSPLNHEYNTIGYTDYIDPSTPIPAWGGLRPKNPYPTSYNSDKFELINKGDKKGVQMPFNVIDYYKGLNLEKESSLGLVGGQQLETSIINKIAQIKDEANKDTLSTGNITPPSGEDGGVNSYINRLRGTEQYYNLLPDGAVGWQEYNRGNKENKEGTPSIGGGAGGYTEPTLSTEQRVNALLKRTSTTQVGFLLDSLNQNIFLPAYEDRRLAGTSDEGTNSRYYIGSEKSTNRGATITQVFQSSEFDDDPTPTSDGLSTPTTIDEDFFWKTGDQTPFNEKTLLSKTQKLVDEHPDGVWINQTKKYFKDKTQDRLISRGNAISSLSLIEAEFNGAFCRVWTVNDQYNYLTALRNTGLFHSPDITKPGFSVSQGNASLSVLGNNGIVQSHPTKEDSTTTFKKYMLSLENLAWSDNLADLPLSEIGPGDILSGNKGRIMWFPPYDLAIDENVGANWTKTDFIGRGEPVFTYNNSTRGGQLKFKILVDHPKVINGYRGKRTNAIERFFAGCITPNDFLDFLDKNNDISQLTKAEAEKAINEQKPQKVTKRDKQQTSFTAFFKENSETEISNQSEVHKWCSSDGKSFVSDMVSTDNKIILMTEGYAGKDELEPNTLAKTRSQNVYTAILSCIGNPKVKKKVKSYGKSQASTLKSDAFDPNNSRVDILLENNALAGKEVEHKEEVGLGDIAYYPQDAQFLDNLIIDENKYFDFIDGNYPNYFETISHKIKYFHPGYHSLTPEGLNTRLTFLHQCMRQGPSVYKTDPSGKGVQPQNLAFGKPPVCILRIGDFFHTKIIINSMSITYATGGAPQWDLNPEGIGVQPIIADVNLSIDIIGGQSLLGPINRLQNALSFNYYANTEMYDPRADHIDKGKGAIVDGIKLGEMKTALGVDIDKLAESLKKEGITNQTKDSSETGDNSQTDSKGGITINSINPKGDKSRTHSKIVVVSTPKPSEVVFKKETNKKTKSKVKSDNKLAIKIEVERPGIGYTTTIKNVEVNNAETTYSMNQWGGNVNMVSVAELDTLETNIATLEEKIATAEENIEKGTFTNIQAEQKIIKDGNKDIKGYQKDIDKINKKSNKVKVEAYYTEDKKGSKKKREFTYGTAGLT